MAEESYRIILKGYSTDKGEYYIEEDFAKLFKITREKAKELFNAVPTVIKSDLSSDKANQYKTAIEKTGAVCEVESNNFDFGGLSLE